MATNTWIRPVAIATVGALTSLTLIGGVSGTSGASASAAPAGAAGSSARQDIQAEDHDQPDRDLRPGSVAPSARQRQLAASGGAANAAADATVRWNRLGTPAVVTGTSPGAALAAGLPADPEAAARAYLSANRELFGLSQEAISGLERVAVNPLGRGAAVLLRQRFGDLPAGHDGQVALGVVDGKVVHVTSSLARDTSAPAGPSLTGQQALTAASRDAGIGLAGARTRDARLVAVPTPQGPRSAYEVTLIGTAGTELAGYTTYVDARTGKVLIRESIVDHAADPDNPHWSVFPSNPPADYSSTDTRQTWCFLMAAGCDFVPGGDPATGRAWDVDHVTGQPTTTTIGNAARTFENRASRESGSVGTRSGAPRPDRNYIFPWTNQWQEEKCDPATLDSPGEADLEAAMANLFAMHNRMHDWSYRLGFTETAWNMQSDNGERGGLGNDPEQGNAQAGARHADIRNNANQATPRDGLPAITNMFLWQPVAGSFYAPCVDGDYDMSVIGHEYTHAISGRMVAGPNAGWSGSPSQAGAMNESTSDLFAMEYLFENGFRPAGDTPYVTGGYVTGDRRAGIRNYDMSKSPLNYSDIAYDLVGQQVHADGEIWSATQFDVRQRFVDRYGAGSTATQRACAEGTRPLTDCPGNRRWAQLAFDALLLMATGDVSYVDHRDALLAADAIRFGGADHDIMWPEFARHGIGSGAFSAGTLDPNPVPSFQSPTGPNGVVTLKPSGDAKGASVRLYVGDYEGRAVPIADTDPNTTRGDTFRIVPGTYTFVAAGAGFGHKRLTATIRPGTRSLSVSMPRNHAAAVAGAGVVGGDGIRQPSLIDETEETNWTSTEAPEAGRQVSVDLAGDRPVAVDRVQVSAMLNPVQPGDPEIAAGGTTQNRYTGLRRFEVLACNAAAGVDCTQDGSYRPIFTSAADAFPARVPRPRAPDLILGSFDVRDTQATHLRLRVLTSQCTGNPAYAGEQDNDPRATTDCATGSPFRGVVRAAEFQAFSS